MRGGSCHYRRRRKKSNLLVGTSAKSTSVADHVQCGRGAWMSKEKCRIGVVAPGSRMSPEVVERVQTLAGSLYPDRTPEIFFHPQCFASHGHFAGDDETRTKAFLDIANDESYDAVWFALAWMVDRAPEALEPTVGRTKKTAAFNMTVLSQLLGTPLQPDLDGHVLMLEEVGEAMYRIDRSLFHITSNAEIRRVSGVMLGRCSGITPNEPDFGMHEEEVARYWCRRSGIPWLGRADIGHDIDNKIVPFGSHAPVAE